MKDQVAKTLFLAHRHGLFSEVIAAINEKKHKVKPSENEKWKVEILCPDSKKKIVLCGARAVTLAAILIKANHQVFFTGYLPHEGRAGHVWILTKFNDVNDDLQEITLELDPFRPGGVPTVDAMALRDTPHCGFTAPARPSLYPPH